MSLFLIFCSFHLKCLDANLLLLILLGLLNQWMDFLHCFWEILSYCLFKFYLYLSLSTPFETPFNYVSSMYLSHDIPLFYIFYWFCCMLLCLFKCFVVFYSLLANFFEKITYRNNWRPRILLASFISFYETPKGAGCSVSWIYNSWITFFTLPLEWFPLSLQPGPGITVPRSPPLVSS